MKFIFTGKYTEEDKGRFEKIQEEDFLKICQYLQTQPKSVGEIAFKIFDSREGKQGADPNHSISRASARFDEMTIYRAWTPDEDPSYPHETTHLVAHSWTKPYLLTEELDTAFNTKIKKTFEMVSTSFMQEGLSIAVDDIVFGRELREEGEFKFIDDWCKEQIGKMPQKLEDVINLQGFNSLDNKIVVPFAASLSKFLFNTYGVGKYKEMYCKLKETLSPEENIKIIEEVYGLDGDEILKQWHKSCSGRQ